MNLGNKIRALRKEKNLSQEVLATHLGVTSQSVSKWENENSMPDVALIPAIASFFGVSTDELFDYSLFEIEKKVEIIVAENCKYRDTDPAKAEQILRDGLEQYPGNDRLLNCLIYVIPLPERSDEVITLCKQLIENTRYDDVKYDAWRIMAEAYCSLGNYELARAAVEKIPEMYVSKLSVEALLLKDAASLAAARKQKWIAFEDVLQMMGKIATCYEEENNCVAALDEARRALKLIDAMQGDPTIGCFDNYANQIKAHIEELKAKV